MLHKHSFLYRNGLSIVLLIMMFVFLAGQFYTGWKDKNNELTEHSMPLLSGAQYFTSAHFISATFENWESEFLQMAIYVLLTISLRQKGSSESKKLKGEKGAGDETVDREPTPKANAPWPVKKRRYLADDIQEFTFNSLCSFVHPFILVTFSGKF